MYRFASSSFFLDATVDFMTAVIRGSHYASIFKDFDPRRDVFARMTKKAVEAPK